VKTLYLMRHAKAAPPDSALTDHDRQLNDRGERAARRMARYLADHGLIPDHVLCSTAVRARLTLGPILDALGGETSVHYRRALYLTSPDVILEEIRSVDDHTARLLLVGHNPDTQALAVHLAADAHRPEVEAMARKFPTGALAVYHFEVDSWRDIGWGLGRIEAFVKPKALAQSD